MNFLYKTNPDYSLQLISDVAVIIPISENCPKFNGMMKLLGTGAFLWNIFSEGATLDAAVNILVKKYDISEERAREDIKEFIDSLSEHNLIIKETTKEN